MPPTRALLLAALLACTASLALCQTNVKTTVEEDYLKRVTVFPTFKVPANLLQLIPLEKGVPTGQQMRNNHRMIYRGDLSFADAKNVCRVLSQKKKATITATKKRLKETVDVAGADGPCTAFQGMSGASPKATFIILLKRRTSDLARMFTVLRCGAGSTQCQLWRLAKPCLGGRCRVEPDPTLTSQVFSTSSILDTNGAPQEAQVGILTEIMEKLENPGKDGVQQALEVVADQGGLYGEAYENKGAVNEAIVAVKENISNLLELVQDEKSKEGQFGCSMSFNVGPEEYKEELLGKGGWQEDDEAINLLDNPTGGSSSASAFKPAQLPKKFFLKLKEELGKKDTNRCALTSMFGQIDTLEQKFIKLCMSKERLSKQKCTDKNQLSIGYVADCMYHDGLLKQACKTKLHQTQVLNYINTLESIPFESQYSSLPLTRSALFSRQRPAPSLGGCRKRKVPAVKSTVAGASDVVTASLNGTAVEDPNFFGIGLVLRVALRFGSIRLPRFSFGRRLQQGTDRATVVKNLLNTNGQMQVHLSGDILQYYLGGVINPELCCKTEPCFSHAANLIGYDDDEGVWIFENLMGELFGENGGFKIAYSDVDEFGPCGLYSAISQVMDLDDE